MNSVNRLNTVHYIEEEKMKYTIKTYGPHFFRKVYNYVKKNNIKIDHSCDFEFISNEFSYDNQESLIYLRLQLDEE